jgi:hypothetical protein
MNLERLLKLRLVVARFGEMDGAGWWNTRGMLTRLGKSVLGRGFPRTDIFAQARAVFEVARARCREIFNPPNAITLWDLPPALEDAFEGEWRRWCASRDTWLPFFMSVQDQGQDDLFAAFKAAGLFGPTDADRLGKLRRGSEGRSVPIPGANVLNDQMVDLLALGFCKGAKSELLVPYTSVVEAPGS